MTECLKSELDLFSQRDIQTSILNKQEVIYKPLATIDNPTQLEFLIPGHGDFYRDLSTIKLAIKLKMVKADGGDLEENTDISCVNNLLHSLFSQCSIALNGKSITPSEDDYHYRAYIETLLNYGNDASLTHLSTVFWYLDDGVEGVVAKDTNKGYIKRKKLLARSNEVELIGRLHADLFNQTKLLLNGVDIRIRLTKARSEFFLLGPSNDTKVLLKITDASLHVKNIEISPAILLAHSQALLAASAIYPINRVEMKTVTIAAGARGVALDNVILGQIPKTIVFAMVDNESYVGAVSRNPFEFKHYSLSYFATFVNGVQIPAEALTPSFGEGGRNYTMAYHTLFSGTGIHHQNTGHMITEDMFGHGYFLLAFDLTPDSAGTESHSSIPKQGSVRFDLRFKDPLDRTVTCIIYAEYDGTLSIDNNRNVFIDY